MIYLKRPFRAVNSLLLALCMGGFPAYMPAEESQELAELRAQINALQTRLEQIEARTDKASEPRIPPEASTVTVNRKGLVVTSPDKQFTFRIRPRIQIDARYFLDSEDGNSGFTARRVRPVFEGQAGPVQYRIMPELSGTVRILDAWAKLALSDTLDIQAGKFKGPVGLERLQSFSHGLFMERGLPSELTPVRELGIAINGQSNDELINWTLGIYNGTFDGSDQSNNANLGSDDALDAGLRIFAHPFSKDSSHPLNGLGLGLSLSYGSEDATINNSNRDSRIRYRTAGANTFFKYKDGVVADGNRTRFNPQLYYYHGPLGLLTEWIRSSQEFSDTEVDTDAWTFQVGWVLTGENASYKAVRPTRPFDPKSNQWGAFELGLRYNCLEVDDEAFLGTSALATSTSAQEAESWSAAINWYLTDNLRIALNYANTDFSGLGFPRASEEILLSRIQVDF